jgi:hypothetical protein
VPNAAHLGDRGAMSEFRVLKRSVGTPSGARSKCRSSHGRPSLGEMVRERRDGRLPGDCPAGALATQCRLEFYRRSRPQESRRRFHCSPICSPRRK